MTLVEVIVAMTILAMVLGGVLAAMLQSRRLTEGSIYENSALTIVQGYLEQIKSMDLADLINADSDGNARLSSSYSIPTLYPITTSNTTESNPDPLKTTVGSVPTLSSLTPGTTPSGTADNLHTFDMFKDIQTTATATEDTSSTDTTSVATTTQLAWSTVWPNAQNYPTSGTTGATDLHLNLWVWVTDLSGTTTFARKVYGVTLIYTYQINDGGRTRYRLGSVRMIRSRVPSY